MKKLREEEPAAYFGCSYPAPRTAKKRPPVKHVVIARSRSPAGCVPRPTLTRRKDPRSGATIATSRTVSPSRSPAAALPPSRAVCSRTPAKSSGSAHPAGPIRPKKSRAKNARWRNTSTRSIARSGQKKPKAAIKVPRGQVRQAFSPVRLKTAAAGSPDSRNVLNHTSSILVGSGRHSQSHPLGHGRRLPDGRNQSRNAPYCR